VAEAATTGYEVTIQDGYVVLIDNETGEILPPTAEHLEAIADAILARKAAADRLYRERKTLEECARFLLPEGATKGVAGAHTLQWTESRVYRFEREPALLRQLWDDESIPQSAKEKALQIGKKSLTSLKALGSWSGNAQKLVDDALTVVDTKSSLRVE
jgi:glutamate synthase domain-containing protein 2